MKSAKTDRENSLKILIVDQNKVYASIVKEILHKNVEASIDIAVNVFELRRKLAERKYSVVIADLAVTEDEDEISAALQNADCTVIAWTSVNKKCRKNCSSREIRKPSSVDEMRKLIPTFVASW
jgi:DNA-binding NtrC family response regulator